MNRYVDELEEILPDEEDYLHNLTIRRACEKTIELETAIDIISILIARGKLGFPEAEEKKILSKAISEKIKGMKGFRNILVHKYGKVNNEQAYEFLSSHLSDFHEFEKEVRKYLKS